MRTSRSILYTALGTVLCLFYVFQQTEIVKLGYRLKTAEKVLETCMDRKIALQYTLSSLESPINIDKALFFKGDGFEMARDYKLVRLQPRGTSSGVRLAKTSGKSVFKRLASLSWFAAKTAQAQTIK
jgi:hypothetical protein